MTIHFILNLSENCRLSFIVWWYYGIIAEKKKLKSNTEEDYNKALASADPTKISTEDLEKLAKDAMKKFKSLS